ncbi:MAG: hypothetical protein IKK29_05025 [Christensenellaceae bacterium]|nr:hypothetical protein [Christensenellaceae bacterium]
MNEYSLNLSTEEKNLVTGALLNLKMDLITERSDYRDVSELLDKISKQRPLQRVRREAR